MTVTQAPTPGPLSAEDELIERGLRTIRTYDAVRYLRDALTATTARLTGYDWNADPDLITKQQGDAFAAAERVFADLESEVAAYPDIDLPRCEACNGTGKIEEPARTEGANQHSACVRSCDECDGCGFAPDFDIAPTAPVEASGQDDDLKLIIAHTIIEDLRAQHPGIEQIDNERGDIWIPGGSTPQSSGCVVDIHSVAQSVEQQVIAALRPGHTDLMVSPESIDEFLEANPPPVEASGSEWEKLAATIKRHLLGVAPDDQDVVLEDDDWQLILSALLSARPLALGGQNSTPTDFPPDEVLACNTTPARAEDQDEGALSILDCLLDHSGARGSFDAMRHGDAVKDAEELLRSARSPGHTDLMVTPESIDAYMKDNPMEAKDEGAAGEIKSCPFCGGEAEIIHLDDDDNAGGSCVCCTKCQASGNVEFGRKENFVENWNRRAHPSPTAAADADRVRVAVELINAEINAPLTGPTHGAWDRGRIAGLKEALAALKSTAAKEGGRVMAEFQDIKSAPLDGTPIQARIPGHGDDNIIMWLNDCVEDENGLCGSWVFASEYQEPPEDWTDGYCWAVNEDGVRSSWPTHWKPAQ